MAIEMKSPVDGEGGPGDVAESDIGALIALDQHLRLVRVQAQQVKALIREWAVVEHLDRISAQFRIATAIISQLRAWLSGVVPRSWRSMPLKTSKVPAGSMKHRTAKDHGHRWRRCALARCCGAAWRQSAKSRFIGAVGKGEEDVIGKGRAHDLLVLPPRVADVEIGQRGLLGKLGAQVGNDVVIRGVHLPRLEMVERDYGWRNRKWSGRDGTAATPGKGVLVGVRTPGNRS